MDRYVNRIRTESGDLQINYEALANLPQSDKTLSKDGGFADAKATSDAIKNATITDGTLTIDGRSADAKAVGDKFQSVESSISSINNDISDVRVTADNAFPKSGGDISGDINMGGNINMSGNKISGIGDPVDDLDVVNKKYVIDYIDSKHFIVTVILNASNWMNSVAPYTQEIGLENILESDNPHYCVIYSGTNDNKISQKEAFSCIDELITSNGKLMFTCLDDKPMVDLNIQLEVNR